MKIRQRLFLTLMMMLCMPVALLAQDTTQEEEPAQAEESSEPELLTIGSVAPPLDIEHWVKKGGGQFEPVTKFEDGKVYMVEFWATWCGPCIASMPHIAELQQKYADEGLQVVSISNEDLETVQEFLERTVRGEEELTYDELTSAYCLTTDPDQSAHKDYMRAAGQNGIPTAFLVGKTGHIEWIGHPMRIDEPLAQIIAGEWDREAFAKTFRAEQELELLMSKLGRMMQQGETDKVIEELNQAIEKFEDEETVERITTIRNQVVITTGAEGAEQAMDDMMVLMGDNPTSLNRMAWAVVQMHESGTEVRPSLVEKAIEAAEKALKLQPESGSIIDTLAHLEHMQGDLDRAIELMEKAVEVGGDEFPEFEEYLKALKEEKAGDSDG